MAYKDSDELKANERYPLGDYSFRIERSSVPGSTNDKIEAICTDKDGKNARKSIQVLSSTKLDGWYAEANETEVTVYALIQEPEGDQKTSPLDTGPFSQPIKYLTEIVAISGKWTRILTGGYFVTYNARNPMVLCGGPTGTAWHYITYYDGALQSDYEHILGDQFIYDDKSIGVSSTNCPGGTILYPDIERSSYSGAVMWTAVYGTPSGSYKEPKEIMVGRFAIDIEDAGGVGPGSDWTDPGDYDPDWEEGDPTHTLYVTVTGALSGRHNDPIEDPSYSYIPSDKNTVKDYGCGGDGGHGGGGGAGASTVVVHKFATNQANSKEVTAFARRHGYGSGGGKGGKGGDGCILVYY
jgi:hypothetical protein